MLLRHRLATVGAILVGFLLGCGLADFMPWLKIWTILLLGFSACLILVWPVQSARVLVLCLVGFVCGVLRWEVATRAWNVDVPFGELVTVQGWVETAPKKSNDVSQVIVEVLELREGEHVVRLSGAAHIALTTKTMLQYGDEVQFSAKLRRPPRFGSFDGQAYWRVRGVQALTTANSSTVMRNHAFGNPAVSAIYALKEYSAKRVKAILEGDEASLLLGLLFGDQGQLSKDTKSAFRTLGISHLTAVSGYNLTIISLWPVALAGFLPRRLAILAAASLVGVFVIFTGAPSSIVRAGVMAWVVLFGKSFGRAPHTMLLILLTASVMALINPFVVKDDAGFALSFLAFFGLVELGPLIAKRLNRIRAVWIRDLFSQTLGAQIATLPYLLGVFGQFAFIAPLANLVILPLVPVIMLVGLGLTVLSLIPAAIFLKLVGLLYFPLHALLWLVQETATIPHISSDWPRGGYFPWYLMMVIVIWWLLSIRNGKKLGYTKENEVSSTT